MFRLQTLDEPIQFGPYELTHRINAIGKLGEAFRATHRGVEGFEKSLLVKTVFEAFSRYQPFLDALVDKASQAVKLHHANIAQVLDLGYANGRFYLATEFVGGLDLAAVLQMCRALKRSIPQELALLISLETLKAIDYAHRRKDSQLRTLDFCHEDLSPSNIMLSWEGEVKITDFGVTAALRALPPASLPPNPHRYRYIAPEVVQGHQPTSVSDVFALGLLLNESLTGRHPYGVADIDRKAAAGIVPPLAENAPAVDRELCAVIDQMLRPDPRARCNSAHDFFEPLLRLSSRGGSRANARHLADWLFQLRDDFEASDVSDDIESRNTEDFAVLRSSDIQLLTEDEPALELPESDIEVIQDFKNASGVWRLSALQQREYLEPPAGAVPAGIEEPIRRFKSAFVDVQREGGRAFLILGDEGSGKSHVLRYAVSLFAEAGAASHSAHLSEHHRCVALGVPGVWISSAAGIAPSDDFDTAANKLRILASSLDLDAKQLECAMRLAGLDDRATLGHGPLQDLAIAVLDKIIDKLSALGPVLLTVDNIHFIDRPSYQFLLRFLDLLPRRRAILLFAAGDPAYAGYLEHNVVEVIRHVEPDDRSHVVENLFSDLDISETATIFLATAPESLGRIADLAAMTRAMTRRGGFPDQVIQHLLSLDSSSRLATALQTLSPPEIQVVQWLAASNQPLHVMLLNDMMGLPGPQLHSVLQGLLHLGLVIYAAPGRLALASDDLCFTLRTLYDPTLMASLHVYLARRLVRGLREMPGSPLWPRAQEQFARGGDAPAVLELAPIYADYLERAGFPETALVHAQQSLEQLHVSQRASPQQVVHLQLAMARRALEVLQWDLARESVEQVYRTAGIQQMPALWVEALSIDAAILLAAGNFTAALGRLEEAQMAADVANLGGTHGGRARLLMEETRARWCLRYGELVVADELLESTLDSAASDHPEAVGPLLALHAQVCARRGELNRAATALGAAQQLRDQRPSQVLQIRVATAAGALASAQGRLEDAAIDFQEAYDLAHESGHVELLLEVAELLIDALVRSKQGKNARDAIAYALDLSQRYGAHAQLDRIRLAECHLNAAYRGDPEAMVALGEALEAASENGVPSEVIRSAGYLREALERQGRSVEAAEMASREQAARRKRGYAIL